MVASSLIPRTWPASWSSRRTMTSSPNWTISRTKGLCDNLEDQHMDGIEELVEVEEAVVLQDDADAIADDEGVDEFAKTREINTTLDQVTYDRFGPGQRCVDSDYSTHL
ncbi:Os09g0250950 [Oryza sativa Japonica Group]|uniref:Os09g0250950 protein n=1 Tax=Oryza sativa subsp. japonica TaxID=39947 RepID=A0A0P0XKY4_ORYSJ|nr:Os09g0250950 [Oryza sativa Japonica Group]